jgi:hypothetical protein
MLDIKDRKKILKFLKKLYAQCKDESSRFGALKGYGLSKIQIENIIENEDNEYSKTHTDNIKRFFTGIIEHYINLGFNVEKIKEHGISHFDFISNARKLKVNNVFINQLKIKKWYICDSKENKLSLGFDNKDDGSWELRTNSKYTESLEQYSILEKDNFE